MIAFIKFCRDDGSEIFSATATSFENICARLTGWENWVNKETGTGARPCTCHPDDNPPVPCARRYALAECLQADQQQPAANLLGELCANCAEPLGIHNERTDLCPGGVTKFKRKPAADADAGERRAKLQERADQCRKWIADGVRPEYFEGKLTGLLVALDMEPRP